MNDQIKKFVFLKTSNRVFRKNMNVDEFSSQMLSALSTP